MISVLFCKEIKPIFQKWRLYYNQASDLAARSAPCTACALRESRSRIPRPQCNRRDQDCSPFPWPCFWLRMFFSIFLRTAFKFRNFHRALPKSFSLRIFASFPLQHLDAAYYTGNQGPLSSGVSQGPDRQRPNHLGSAQSLIAHAQKPLQKVSPSRLPPTCSELRCLCPRNPPPSPVIIHSFQGIQPIAHSFSIKITAQMRVLTSGASAPAILLLPLSSSIVQRQATQHISIRFLCHRFNASAELFAEELSATRHLQNCLQNNFVHCSSNRNHLHCASSCPMLSLSCLWLSCCCCSSGIRRQPWINHSSCRKN